MTREIREIEYRFGEDIFDVKSHEDVIIAHVVNNLGAFGKGFAQEVAERWPHVKTHYRANFLWYSLGDVLYKDVNEAGNIVVVNLFAQNGLPSRENPSPLDYEALETSLKKLAAIWADCQHEYTVRMPKIGTGYGGGDWDIIEAIIKQTLCLRGIRVEIFTKP